MTVGDRLRAVPRPWWVIGICGLAVVLAFVLVSWTGSSGSVASNDGQQSTLTDHIVGRPDDRHVGAADASHPPRRPAPRAPSSRPRPASTVDHDRPVRAVRNSTSRPTTRPSSPGRSPRSRPTARRRRRSLPHRGRRARAPRQAATSAPTSAASTELSAPVARQVLRRSPRPAARVGLPARLSDG